MQKQCLQCGAEFNAQADYQKLCIDCYRAKPKKASGNDEIMDASRKIYGKLLELAKQNALIISKLEKVEDKLQEIEIQELKLRLAHLGVNLEKLLAKNGTIPPTTS